MEAARQLLPAHLAAVDLLKVTRLVMECCFRAQTGFFNEIHAWWTIHIIGVALVVDRRMSTTGLSSTLVCARRLTSTTRLWWMKNSSAAAAGDFLPNGLWAALAGSTVTKLFTTVTTAL